MHKKRIFYLAFAIFFVTCGLAINQNLNFRVQHKAANASSQGLLITDVAGWNQGSGSNFYVSGDPNSSVTINNKVLQEFEYIPTGYTVTSMPEAGSGTLLDGNLCTYWSDPDPYYPPNYLQIDLGSVMNLRVAVYNNAGATVRQNFISTDGVDWSTPFPITGTGITNDCGGQYNMFELITSNDYHSFRYFKTTMATGSPPLNYVEKISELKFYKSNATATHTSAPTQIDGGANFWQWETFTDTKTVPANTSITYRYRTSPDSTTWTAWAGSIGAVTSRVGDTKYRYLQVEATLKNTDGISTPTIDQYDIGYHTNQKPSAPTAAGAVVQ